jgi:pimeloyl-ACP methyl ester carboxylesterase
MFFHESGTIGRPTIVFLHGNGANGTMWKTHMERLTESPSSFTRSILQANAMRQPPGLEEVACPVLFVAGENEPNAVKRSGFKLAEIMPNAESRTVPGMGHGWLAEAPDLHIRMVRAWVNDESLPQELLAVR